MSVLNFKGNPVSPLVPPAHWSWNNTQQGSFFPATAAEEERRDAGLQTRPLYQGCGLYWDWCGVSCWVPVRLGTKTKLSDVKRFCGGSELALCL